MAARALSFAAGWLRQWWHCDGWDHVPYAKRWRGRVWEIGCATCRRVFWRGAV